MEPLQPSSSTSFGAQSEPLVPRADTNTFQQASAKVSTAVLPDSQAASTAVQAEPSHGQTAGKVIDTMESLLKPHPGPVAPSGNMGYQSVSAQGQRPSSTGPRAVPMVSPSKAELGWTHAPVATVCPRCGVTVSSKASAPHLVGELFTVSLRVCLLMS